MGRNKVIAAALVAGLFCSIAASAAYAQAQPRRSETLAGLPVLDSSVPRTNRPGLQLNPSGRWGLNLDVEQPVGREADWNDIDASASYRLSPSLRLRGTVGLGERRPDPARPQQQERDQPRVRLETIFRF